MAGHLKTAIANKGRRITDRFVTSNDSRDPTIIEIFANLLNEETVSEMMATRRNNIYVRQ